jgi:hypothetical protein
VIAAAKGFEIAGEEVGALAERIAESGFAVSGKAEACSGTAVTGVVAVTALASSIAGFPGERSAGSRVEADATKTAAVSPLALGVKTGEGAVTSATVVDGTAEGK